MTKEGCDALPVPVLFVASRWRVLRHPQAVEMAPRCARRRAADQSRRGRQSDLMTSLICRPSRYLATPAAHMLFGLAVPAHANAAPPPRSRRSGQRRAKSPPTARPTAQPARHRGRTSRPHLCLQGRARHRRPPASFLCCGDRANHGLSRLDLARGRLRLGLLAATAPLRLSSPARAAHSSRGKKVSPRRPPPCSGPCGVRRRPPRAGRSPSRPRWARSR